MWSLTELVRQLMRDPLHLFDGNIYYPFPHTLAVLDHQIASALSAVPLSLAGAGGALIYNTVVLSTFVLSGFFTYLLVRRLTGSTAAGLVSGCAFAFSTYRVNHLLQSHLLATQWLPLALLMLHRYFDRPTRKRWAAFALVTLLVALSSWHIAVIGAIGIGVVSLWTMTSDPRESWRRLAGVLLVAAICALALLPVARIYARTGDLWPPQTGEGRESMGTLADLSVNVIGLLSPAARSSTPYWHVLPDSQWSRPGAFPGVVTCLLMLPALGTILGSKMSPSTPGERLLRWWLWCTLALTVAIVVAAIGGSSPLSVDLLPGWSPFCVPPCRSCSSLMRSRWPAFCRLGARDRGIPRSPRCSPMRHWLSRVRSWPSARVSSWVRSMSARGCGASTCCP
jgi:hypothetical protein